ncbi:MAG TPA: cation diffusion facilitator family transporter [Polyangiaceae bacterium]|jgi:cation diffusion facilitator family transporter|nr:cation diffusion facilitator family transporter [Polyangiaceae bacterium]
MSHSSGDPRKVVIAALGSNALIALAKFVAAALSGSAAMLAEATHSLADTANQALLLVGMKLSSRTNPERYPLGRASERYFWAFVVSLLLFLMGGLFAIYEGVHKLLSPSEKPTNLLISAAVLVVSLGLEGASFWVASKEFARGREGRSLRAALFDGRDPTIPLVLLEDTGAVIGLGVALISILVTWITGSTVADAVGSLVIGVLLCTVGLSLAFETHGLLIGEGVTREVKERALGIVRATPGVEAVTQFLSLHLGPDTILLALKIRFRRGAIVEEVEQTTNLIEERIRSVMPEMKKIFVEADGGYDGALDPAMTTGVAE